MKKIIAAHSYFLWKSGHVYDTISRKHTGMRVGPALDKSCCHEARRKLMNYNESAENYLETILILSRRLPVVRSLHVAAELNFKKSSVSVAMKHLREKEQITVTDAGFIYLTDTGREIAEMIYERHEFLTNWLISLKKKKKIEADF